MRQILALEKVQKQRMRAKTLCKWMLAFKRKSAWRTKKAIARDMAVEKSKGEFFNRWLMRYEDVTRDRELLKKAYKLYRRVRVTKGIAAWKHFFARERTMRIEVQRIESHERERLLGKYYNKFFAYVQRKQRKQKLMVGVEEFRTSYVKRRALERIREYGDYRVDKTCTDLRATKELVRIQRRMVFRVWGKKLTRFTGTRMFSDGLTRILKRIYLARVRDYDTENRLLEANHSIKRI